MNKKRLIGYLLVIVSVGCIHAQEKKLSVPEYKLWYDCPAQVWTEALPLGNGRLGAMVYGTPGTEQIQLNEESIWAPKTTWLLLKRLSTEINKRKKKIWQHKKEMH